MIKIKIKKKLLSANDHFELDINLEIASNQFITLYGKSGAGKTTALRILAGLTQPDEGFIEVDGTVWLDSQKGINLPPQKRQAGLVFQDYALFPNMTVRKNLEYALADRQDTKIVDMLLELGELTNLADRKPETLSGGQRQRAALTRALVRKPKILLLDEPLSALDAQMRRMLQDVLLSLHKRFKTTTVLVSHNLSEIFKLSNRVAVIDNGKIVDSGPIADVFIGKKLSGKFKFEGEILQIQQNEVVFILTISIGNNLVKVIASENEARQFKVGDRLIVSSKAFNPILMPVK